MGFLRGRGQTEEKPVVTPESTDETESYMDLYPLENDTEGSRPGTGIHEGYVIICRLRRGHLLLPVYCVLKTRRASFACLD